MESFLPLSGFQLPFQQRLSRLYNDTKKSSDFVKEPVQNEEDPEIRVLHRKLRIQKDRLASWGVEWSDPTQAVEIDESLSKAGLSEVVGSIMSTIKSILAEAEPLWLSSKHLTEGNLQPTDRKAALIQWDKSHFEDLIRDLTSSIDTLYDLSRTRSTGAVPRRPAKTPNKLSSTEESRPFESTRMQTPQAIRPDSLTHLQPKQGARDTQPREVVFMSKTAYSELTQGTTREPWAPLLLEYATFDSIYSATGIMPPMSRFEKLSAGLQQDPQRSPGVWTGLPRLLGYFEDVENSRLGLLYRFPQSFNAVSFQNSTKNPHYNLPTLADLLFKPEAEPKLEAKFRLAHNLTNTLFDMHTRGIAHGHFVPRNISFSDTVTSGPMVTSGEVDVRRPLVSSFDIFPEDTLDAQHSISRHPLDPRLSEGSPLSKSTDERVLELYSLAMVLLSIGLWRPIEDLTATASVEALLDSLAQKCGTLYMKAVHACWSAVDNEHTGACRGESLLSSVQMRAARFLETCCILDGVSGLEHRLSEELRSPEPTSHESERTATLHLVDTKDSKAAKSRPAFSPTSQPTPLPEPIARTEPSDIETEDSQGKIEGKIKLYPNIPLPPDAVEKWNTILMPQINQALRQFYRKHPESVEISLESVGPSPLSTKPTVLVVCSSVGKVRAILKKRLGDLFDGSTGFDLKVCRGHVVRSRRWSKDAMRSMARSNNAEAIHGKADTENIDAINPEFQDRPGNGASIGAWIGDRHLPPVSFGGLILVDDKPYGMTVHHMLDDPDRDFGDADTARSSVLPGRNWTMESKVGEDDFAYELSDTESEAYSESDISSDWGDEDAGESDNEFEAGDIPGIEPGCGEGYVVTQPALDDVEDGFYPSDETQDEDHLDTFGLGEVYASSGIRRKTTGGLTHEVDWALFEFAHDREPSDNFIPLAQATSTGIRPTGGDTRPVLRPTAIAPSSSLPGLEVQCTARTSGLQTGRILPALTSVKIYGRASPSHTYQVASTKPLSISSGEDAPIGIPGDSGAWIIDRQNGKLCGHVLAWSQRKQVAYICPMEVLIMDIAQTLEASEVKLPDGEVLVRLGSRQNTEADPEADSEAEDISSIDDDAVLDTPAPEMNLSDKAESSEHMIHSLASLGGDSTPGSSPFGVTTSKSMSVLSRSIDDLSIHRGIGVSG